MKTKLDTILEKIFIAILKFFNDSEFKNGFENINNEYLHYATCIPTTFQLGAVLNNLKKKGFISIDGDFNNPVIKPCKSTDSNVMNLTFKEMKVYYFLRYVFESNFVSFESSFPIHSSAIAKGVKLEESETQRILNSLIKKNCINLEMVEDKFNWKIIDIPTFDDAKEPTEEEMLKELIQEVWHSQVKEEKHTSPTFEDLKRKIVEIERERDYWREQAEMLQSKFYEVGAISNSEILNELPL